MEQRLAVHLCLPGYRRSEDYACTAERRPGDLEHTRAAKPTQVNARAIDTPTLLKDGDGLSAVYARAFEAPLPPKDRDGPLDMARPTLQRDMVASTLHGDMTGPTLQGDTLPANPAPSHTKSKGGIAMEHHHPDVGRKRSDAAKDAPTAGVQSKSPGVQLVEEGYSGRGSSPRRHSVDDGGIVSGHAQPHCPATSQVPKVSSLP